MKKQLKNGSTRSANPLNKILAEIRDELREHNRLQANAHKIMLESIKGSNPNDYTS